MAPSVLKVVSGAFAAMSHASVVVRPTLRPPASSPPWRNRAFSVTSTPFHTSVRVPTSDASLRTSRGASAADEGFRSKKPHNC